MDMDRRLQMRIPQRYMPSLRFVYDVSTPLLLDYVSLLTDYFSFILLHCISQKLYYISLEAEPVFSRLQLQFFFTDLLTLGS